MKTTKRNGNLVSVQEVVDDDDLIIITNSGKVIRQHVGSISVISRNTQGMRLITLNEKDKVTDVARVAHQEEEISEDDENGNGIENNELDEEMNKIENVEDQTPVEIVEETEVLTDEGNKEDKE